MDVQLKVTSIPASPHPSFHVPLTSEPSKLPDPSTVFNRAGGRDWSQGHITHQLGSKYQLKLFPESSFPSSIIITFWALKKFVIF